MPARVLYGDLSKNGHLTLALGCAGSGPEAFERLPCDSLEQLEDGLSGFLRRQDVLDIDAAAFSACGWEQAGGLSMHNHNFTLSRAWLKDVLRIQRLHLVNDCVAMAMAVGQGAGEDLVAIHAVPGDSHAVKALIAAGGGLGTATIMPEEDGRHIVLPCEGGHSALAVAGDEEIALVRKLRRRFGHVSRERAISLGGLAAIYSPLGELHGGSETAVEGAEVIARARACEAPAMRAFGMLMGWLAAMASDIALTTGSRGGVYLSGGLLEQTGDLIDHDAFSRRFTDKGRLSGYCSKIPVYHFKLPEQMIRGLSTLFEHDYH